MTEIKVVIGANYGDEGKGLASNYFSDDKSITVLTNGGAQRAHTVMLPDGRRHIFRHFGAGTMIGSATFFSADFILNPITFMQEYSTLVGIYDCTPICFRDSACRWSTPYDMIINSIRSRGKDAQATCGAGIWETVQRSLNLEYSMPFDNFISLPDFKKVEFLQNIRDNYYKKENKNLSKELKEIYFSNGLMTHFIEDCLNFAHLVKTREMIFLNDYDKVVFENGQGLLLDGQIKGQEDFTTPSRTGLCRVSDMINKTFNNADVEVCYVSRTYLTRHGRGAMESEITDYKEKNNLVDFTNIPNVFQGSLRYGEINFNKLYNRIEADFSTRVKDNKNHYSKSVMFTHCNKLRPDRDKGVKKYFSYEETGTGMEIADF